MTLATQVLATAMHQRMVVLLAHLTMVPVTAQVLAMVHQTIATDAIVQIMTETETTAILGTVLVTK